MLLWLLKPRERVGEDIKDARFCIFMHFRRFLCINRFVSKNKAFQSMLLTLMLKRYTVLLTDVKIRLSLSKSLFEVVKEA